MANNARLTQLRFTENGNTRSAVLDISLPERPTDEVAMDRTIGFHVLVVPRHADGGASFTVPDRPLSEDDIAR